MNTTDMSQDEYDDLVAQETGNTNKLLIVESKSRDGVWLPVLSIRAALTEAEATKRLDEYFAKKKRQSRSGKAENRDHYQIVPYRRGLPITPPPADREAQAEEMRTSDDSADGAPTSEPEGEMRTSDDSPVPAPPPPTES